MSSRMHRRRRGLSLIEMMIATALLAASALLIQSLIGTGARFGVKAEQRTMAVGLAELALQEAMLDDESNDRETTEAFAHNPSWSYRIRQTPLETENLVEWKVDIFLTKDVDVGGATTKREPVFSLRRWQRRPLTTGNELVDRKRLRGGS